jgi:predicted amidohydrolase
MTVKGGEPDLNLSVAEKRIAEASAQGAQVVLLPEAMDLGWTHPSALTLAEPLPDGRPCKRLRSAARRHRVYVCAGLVERDGDRVYNSAVLIGPDGGVLLRHRKINELDIGHPFYALGDRLNVCRTDLCTFGLFICADATAAGGVLARSLGYMGADVILSPAAWAVPADHDNARDPYGATWTDAYGPPARDFSIWIAGASNVGPLSDGPWKGWNAIGCSLVMDPEGRVRLQGPYGAKADTVLYVEIAPMPRPARGTDWNKRWERRGGFAP